VSLSWGNWDVRVYAAEAWVSLAPRFAAENPEIVEQIDAILRDPVAAVRLQAAQNLQVISVAAPDRMWEMAERLAQEEPDPRIVSAFIGRSLLRFSHSQPERCETILSIVRERMADELSNESEGRDHIQETLGHWVAQLYAGQGRPLLRGWLDEWASDPTRFRTLLNSYSSSLRGAYFHRYAKDAELEACEMNERAQEGLLAVLKSALSVSDQAYAVLASDAEEEPRQASQEMYGGAEQVIHHAMNQLYFGAGAHSENEGGKGLLDREAMKRFLDDYAEILVLLARSREPATLHHLIELYEYLIPGDPVAVFEAIHSILLGRGEAEGYQYESLGSSAVVRIVRRYIADHRSIFEDEGRRAHLLEILQLFSEAGWSDALRLLYDLPDLLR